MNQTSVFVGGNIVTGNPAFYAQAYAMEFLEVPAGLISITSIGGDNYKVDEIGSSAGPLTWVTRLGSLTTPVKKFTQEYMARQIVDRHNQRWEAFEL